MRSFLLLAVASSATQFHEERDLSEYSYEEYQREFGKASNGEDRQGIFEQNLELIRQHNADPSKKWFATVNQFTDMTNDEFRSATRGRKGNMFGGSATPHRLGAKALPASVDWRDQGVVTPAKDQGSCGSCWAFSAAETFESQLAIQTQSQVQKLSPQQIVSCSPNPQHCGGSGGCDGSTQPLAFEYTKTAGLTTEASYPYQAVTGSCQSSKIEPVAYNSGYAVLPTNDYSALMDAVANTGPVAISIAAGGFAFQMYGGGVLSNCNDFVMDHAVQLVGYGSDGGEDYWLVRNSWGGGWGEKGYIRLRRYGDGKEPCGTDSKPQDGDACEGDTSPRTYCGECGILSSSSYPTNFTSVQPAPSPPPPTPPPAPTPPPTPTPSPTPGPCQDTEDQSYCSYVVEQGWCNLIGADCLQSCDCCEDPSACGASDSWKAKALAAGEALTV